MNNILVSNNYVPFFSVIICTFNRGYIIECALKSLLYQEEQDWEAIIVDDGSDDNTTEIVKRYIADNPKFRYMYHQNKGLALSRNVGLLASSGLYCTFLDSDDEYHPEHLKFRKRMLQQNKDVILLHGGVEVIGSPMVPDRDNPKKMIFAKDCALGGTFCINRTKALEIGGFNDIPFCEDYDFHKRVFDKGWVVAKTDVATYIYNRTSEDSMTNKMKNKAQTK